MIENKFLGIFLLLEGIFGRYIWKVYFCARGGHEGGMLHWWNKDICEAAILQGTILSLQPLLVRW